MIVRHGSLDPDMARKHTGKQFVNRSELYHDLKEALRAASEYTNKVEDKAARQALAALNKAIGHLAEIQHAALNAVGEKPPPLPLNEAENGQ